MLVKTLAAAFAVCCLAGCNSEDTQKISQDAKNLAEHTGQAVGSMTMAGKIKFVLAQRKSIDMSGVDISFKDGVATITGKAKSPADKRRIVEAVNDIRGVDKVDAQLTAE